MENNSQVTQLSPDAAENKLDFKKIIYTFLQYWLWYLIAFIVCFVMAFVYLRYTTPLYKITSKILIKDDKGSGADPQDILSQIDIFNTKNNVSNEKEVLQTYYLVEKVVEGLQLNVTCFAVGSIKSTELYKKSPFKIQLIALKDSVPVQVFKIKFSDNNSAFTIEGDSLHNKYHFNDTVKTNSVSFVLQPGNAGFSDDDKYEIDFNTLTSTTERYLRKLSFNITDKQASVIEITLQDALPHKGEDILNKLYDVYTRVNEEDKNKIADSTISFIDERLAVVANELSGVEKDIEKFKIKNQLSTNIDEQAKLALDNASTIQQQLVTQDMQISVVQSLEDHLRGKSQRIVPNAGVIQDPTYISTVQEYNTLVLERDRQLETTKPDNPVVKNLNSQINAVKSNLLVSLDNIKREMQISRNELSAKNNQFLSEIKSGPSKERAYLDISRQQNVKQQLYLYLLQKREETAISKSGTLANSRLIEPGRSDMQPFTPKNSFLYLIAFLAAIALPSGSIYLKKILNNTINEDFDIAKETNVPVLGEIGHNITGKPIVAEQNSRTSLAEQFRALRTNLQFLLKGKENQVIMITSSVSGEGKSFLSTNLGSSLAISNKRVVLMELDLRKPKISKELGLTKETGFTDYLISKCKKENIIKPTSVHPNLFLISSGTIPPNPAELLLDAEVEKLFAWLRTQFDYIIVDTPPAGVVIDPVLISKYADASIYVVRQGYTLKEQLKIVNQFKQNEKLKNLSILINDVKINRVYGYKYGYKYGYGYGYASEYYTDGKKKKKRFFKS